MSKQAERRRAQWEELARFWVGVITEHGTAAVTNLADEFVRIAHEGTPNPCEPENCEVGNCSRCGGREGHHYKVMRPGAVVTDGKEAPDEDWISCPNE